jgi:hypothetical protein
MADYLHRPEWADPGILLASSLIVKTKADNLVTVRTNAAEAGAETSASHLRKNAKGEFDSGEIRLVTSSAEYVSALATQVHAGSLAMPIT